MKQIIIPALLSAIILHAPAAALAETIVPSPQAPEPHLVFKKSVVVKDYDTGKAHSEQRVVKKGDHFWKILREQYNMSDTSINFFYKIAKAVNPAINDLNVLQPNQNILLPFKYVPGDGSDNSTIIIDTKDYHHQVNPNEHLSQILRKNFDLPDNVIFNRITKSLIKEANPDITDLNHISPGQTITIPREVFAMRQFIDHNVLPDPVTPAPSAQPDPDPETDVIPAEQMSFTEEPLNNDEQEIKQLLTQMTHQFEGTDNSTGQEFFSTDDNESITLDYEQFPTYNLPWGKKVVLDYESRMLEKTRSAIAQQWKNAEVVSVTARDDIESIIGRVLDVCGFYKVEKDGNYTVNRDAIQLSVTGNWIVFKDSTLRNVFIVNLAQDGQSTINPGLRSYLADLGLDIQDIGLEPRNAPEETVAPAVAAPGREASYTQTNGVPAALINTILQMLGIPFEAQYKTNIYQNMYNEFTLEVIADRMFRSKGTVHLIDFNSLPDRIVSIITQQGFKLLQLTPGSESADEMTGRLLDYCGADYQPPPVTLSFDHENRQNVSLTMPGYLVETINGRTLLTGSEVNESISDFLLEEDIAIIKY